MAPEPPHESLRKSPEDAAREAKEREEALVRMRTVLDLYREAYGIRNPKPNPERDMLLEEPSRLFIAELQPLLQKIYGINLQTGPIIDKLALQKGVSGAGIDSVVGQARIFFLVAEEVSKHPPASILALPGLSIQLRRHVLLRGGKLPENGRLGYSARDEVSATIWIPARHWTAERTRSAQGKADLSFPDHPLSDDEIRSAFAAELARILATPPPPPRKKK